MPCGVAPVRFKLLSSSNVIKTLIIKTFLIIIKTFHNITWNLLPNSLKNHQEMLKANNTILKSQLEHQTAVNANLTSQLTDQNAITASLQVRLWCIDMCTIVGIV